MIGTEADVLGGTMDLPKPPVRKLVCEEHEVCWTGSSGRGRLHFYAVFSKCRFFKSRPG